jgi:hypothetical protein
MLSFRLSNIDMLLKSRRLIILICFAWGLLLVPYIAGKFTNEVNWTSLDYLAMLILLSTAAITVELILRTFLDLGNRIKYLIFVGLFFLLVWLQLAVGIF